MYRHPSQPQDSTNAGYVTLVGENTATGNGETPITESDGARTILVTEATTDTPWTKPEDSLVGDQGSLPARRPQRDGWNVVFVDGSAHFISSDTSAEVLRALATRNGIKQIVNDNGVWKKVGETRNDRIDKTPAANESDKQPFDSSIQPKMHSEKEENAALVYWQAFALLPELSGEDTKLLTDLEKGSELGVDARSLLTRSKTALSLISHLQPDMPCRWELIENGPSTLLPHLSKARTLARLLVLQARVDAESGKMEAAVDHLTQAFLVARNVDEGVLVQMVVGDAIESLAADVALSLLPKLDASSRDRFAEALSKLPKRTTFTQAMRHERDVFGRGAGKMMSDALEQLGKGEDSPAVRAILAGTEKRQAMWLEELLAEYDKVIEASELPLAEANKNFERIEEEVQDSSNPLIQLMMPSLVGTNQKHARVDARIAKLETRLRDAETSAGKLDSER